MSQAARPGFYAKVCQFKVTLDEIEVAEFREARGLTVVHEVLGFSEGGMNDREHKLVGAARYSPIVLSFGSSSSTALFDWVKAAIGGQIQRKNGSIMALDQIGDVVCRWDFMEAWPSNYSGPSFDARDSDVAIERLELSHRGFDMKPAESTGG